MYVVRDVITARWRMYNANQTTYLYYEVSIISHFHKDLVENMPTGTIQDIFGYVLLQRGAYFQDRSLSGLRAC